MSLQKDNKIKTRKPLPAGVKEYIKQLYETYPIIPANEIVEIIKERFGRKISRATIYNIANREGWKRGSSSNISLSNEQEAEKALNNAASSGVMDPILSSHLIDLVRQGLESDQILAQAAKSSLGWHLKRDAEARKQIDQIETAVAMQGGSITPAQRSTLAELRKRLLSVKELIMIAKMGIIPSQQVNVILQKNQFTQVNANDNQIKVIFELLDQTDKGIEINELRTAVKEDDNQD